MLPSCDQQACVKARGPAHVEHEDADGRRWVVVNPPTTERPEGGSIELPLVDRLIAMHRGRA